MSQQSNWFGKEHAAGAYHKIKTREVVVLAVCFALLLCLGGCGTRNRCRMVGNEEVLRENSIRMSYDLLDGSREYEVRLSQPTKLRVEILTRSGRLALKIGQEGQKPIYTGNSSGDFSFSVFAEAGSYTITLMAERHVGSYEFEWTDVRP